MTSDGSTKVTGLTLVMPDKSDLERDAVASQWEAAGGSVLRLGRFWDPPHIEASVVRVYGNESFCRVLEQKLGLDLCSPADDLIVDIAPRFLGRSITLCSVDAIAVSSRRSSSR